MKSDPPPFLKTLHKKSMARLHSKASRYALLAAVLGFIILFWFLFVEHQKSQEAFTSSEEDNEPIVTFVIPTVGRDSLHIPLQSLLYQKDPRWRAIVVYDGITDKVPTVQDPRIIVLHVNKKGKAGPVRNEAIPHIQTEWVAFLDDDDAVSPLYVDRLSKTIQDHDDAEVVIFRFKNIGQPNLPASIILPSMDTEGQVTLGRVGISFCARKSVCESVQFKDEKDAEDFSFLHRAIPNHVTLLSKYVSYAVRPTAEQNASSVFWNDLDELRGKESVVRISHQ